MNVKDEMQKEFGGSVNIIKPVNIGNLDSIKEEKSLIPPSRGVKFQIKKAAHKEYKDGAMKLINLQLSLIDGIGEERKYKGMGIFATVTYFADPDVYTHDYFKNNQHLINLKNLFNSVNLTNKTVVNDETFAELEGQIILADIIQKKGQQKKDKETKELLVDEDGNPVFYDPSNEVLNYKKVPIEDQV